MTRKTTYMGLIALAVCAGASGAAHAESRYVLRDASYEEYLRVRANPDEKITPIRVIRWMRGLAGQQVSAPSATEFQPVVDANKDKVRIIAALSIKFF